MVFTDAYLDTIGSAGASLVASLDVQRRTDLCHSIGRRIFRQPSVLPVPLVSVELVQFSVSLSSFFVFCFAWHLYIILGIYSIGSSGATDFSRTRPIQRFFEFFLRVLLCMPFYFIPGI